MQKILKSTFGIVSLLFCASCFCQPKELSVGDKCPDILFKKIINYSSSEAWLSDFKGKLVILDFWEPSCKPCITAFPRFDSLQKIFGNKIQIIPVSRGEESLIKTFWKNNKITRSVSLPTVVEDSLLRVHFPFEGVPHEVWIDEDQIVRGITTAQYVNTDNIQAILDKKEVNWPIKKIGIYHYDEPLLVDNNDLNSRRLYYTAISGWLAGGIKPKSKYYIDSLKGFTRFYAINLPVLMLYKVALQNSGFRLWSNRLILEVKDSARYYYEKSKIYKEDWDSDNCYCYETILPGHIDKKELFGSMISDLNRFLHLDGRLEERLMHSLSLVRTKESGIENKHISTSNIKYITFNSINSLIDQLNYDDFKNPPILDKTGINQTASISLENSPSLFSDIPKLRKELEKYGLTLRPSKERIWVFVITEKR